MKLGERSDLVSTLGVDGLQVYWSGGMGHRVSEESEDNYYHDLGGGIYMGVIVLYARR